MKSNAVRPGIALLTAFLIGVASARGTAFAEDSQDNAAKAKPAEGKKAVKTVDIHLRVSTEKGEPVPPGEVVISLEEACWPETSPDPRQTIETKTGEVSFSRLPACSATVIIRVDGYTLFEMEMNGKKQTTRGVNLSQYKTPILITIKKL